MMSAMFFAYLTGCVDDLSHEMLILDHDVLREGVLDCRVV